MKKRNLINSMGSYVRKVSPFYMQLDTCVALGFVTFGIIKPDGTQKRKQNPKARSLLYTIPDCYEGALWSKYIIQIVQYAYFRYIELQIIGVGRYFEVAGQSRFLPKIVLDPGGCGTLTRSRGSTPVGAQGAWPPEAPGFIAVLKTLFSALKCQTFLSS